MELSYVLAGALTGFLVGLTGVGGGSLMTPLLVLLFGVAPQAAVGTDLWFAAGTKLVASRLHHSKGLVDWPVVKRLWLGSLTCATLTLLWMHGTPVSASTGQGLTTAIAWALLVSSLGILFQERLHALGRYFRLHDAPHFKAWQGPLTVLAGAVLGVLVTLTSVGAGAIGAVFLAYLYPLRLTTPRLVATDIVHAIPLALFAGIGHLWLGHVEFGLLFNLWLGSVPGVLLGVRWSTRWPQGRVRHVLALVLVLIGAKLLWQAA